MFHHRIHESDLRRSRYGILQHENVLHFHILLPHMIQWQSDGYVDHLHVQLFGHYFELHVHVSVPIQNIFYNVGSS